MRYCCGGWKELIAPSSTRPGSVRQVNGVAVGDAASVGVTGFGVEEAVGEGTGVEVGIGWVEGEQAVKIARSMSNVARGRVHRIAVLIAWRVFILRIIHREQLRTPQPKFFSKEIYGIIQARNRGVAQSG